MKKLSLDIDQLQVESFAPGYTPREQGTVAAHEATDPYGDCWTGTQAGASDFAACDSYWCGDDQQGPSHSPSCGASCQITGYWKCQDGTCVGDW